MSCSGAEYDLFLPKLKRTRQVYRQLPNFPRVFTGTMLATHSTKSTMAANVLEQVSTDLRSTQAFLIRPIKSDGLEREEMHAWSDLSKLFKTFAAICFVLLVLPTLSNDAAA